MDISKLVLIVLLASLVWPFLFMLRENAKQSNLILLVLNLYLIYHHNSTDSMGHYHDLLLKNVGAYFFSMACFWLFYPVQKKLLNKHFVLLFKPQLLHLNLIALIPSLQILLPPLS